MRPPFSFVAQEKTKRMITVYPSLATLLRKNEARSGQFVEGYQAISSPNVTFPLTFPVVCLTCVHE